MTPLALILLILFPRIINDLADIQPKTIRREYAFLAALGFAVLTGIVVSSGKPIEFLMLSNREALAVGFRLDVLSGLISTTVMLIGASIMRFSVRYLADDDHQKQFHRNLATTLCFVLAMLNSSNLILFWLAWVGTSYFLHKLLLHFKDREGARQAANQKFWVSRLGDFFITLASLAIFRVFGTLDFSTINENSSHLFENSEVPLLLYLAGVLIVLGAMTKSAQFPFHFWLPKTMETPTPVSALMHAGIINAGGFLIIRLGGFLDNIPLALHLLAIVGGFTAFFGSIIMLSQTNVKKSLAYSTISQMGFMMLQCGLGAFSIAVVHIIGHAFYKAYSFLGAGSVTDYGKLNRYLSLPHRGKNIWSHCVFGFLAVGFTFFVGSYLGYQLNKPGAMILLLVLGLASAQIFLSFTNKFEALKTVMLMQLTYFVLFRIIDWLLHDSILKAATNTSSFQDVIYGSISILMITLYLVQNNLERISKTKWGKKLYVKSLNGGYLG
jgi:NAD(P)H-quinone oxidoreductase subunit 5